MNEHCRADGWPLCSRCEADELMCRETPGPPSYTWTLAQYLEHDLLCLACGWVRRAGTQAPADG